MRNDLARLAGYLTHLDLVNMEKFSYLNLCLYDQAG